jgi:hypothetical protein
MPPNPTHPKAMGRIFPSMRIVLMGFAGGNLSTEGGFQSIAHHSPKGKVTEVAKHSQITIYG